MTREQELFEYAAGALAEIAAVLGLLKKHHPEEPVIERCIEVEKQLRWYVTDAKEKLRRNELTEKDATALAMIVERGMNRMIDIVETEEKPPHP